MMNRRNAVIAILVGSVGLIARGAQERQEALQTFSATAKIDWVKIQDAWKHWTVHCPETITIVGEAGEQVVLTRQDIMSALRQQ